MSRPKVFISSTYYDMKSIRDDISRFLRDIGYDPIRHEMGQVGYGRHEKPEIYCYREIENSDIVVCIIGGLYGTQSSFEGYSITQKELKSAFDLGKQVFIFVDRPVLQEYKFYLKNKKVKDVEYSAVNDKRVFEFLEEIHSIPKGGSIFPFETSSEISSLLREQLASLFQRLLIEDQNRESRRMFEELKASLATAGDLVKYLADNNQKSSEAITQILTSNHPLFSELRSVLNIKYRVFFTTVSELGDWLAGSRSMRPVNPDEWDSPEYMEWMRWDDLDSERRKRKLLKVWRGLFDAEEKLMPLKDGVVVSDSVMYSEDVFPEIDDDIPF